MAEADSRATERDPFDRYVATVRRQIESEKRYPAMARRRSEEGLVQALLTLDRDGRLESLTLAGDPSLLLRRATRAAVEAAGPFPSPPRGRVIIEVPIRWRITP